MNYGGLAGLVSHDDWLAGEVERLGFRHVLLLRDPRDVAISRAFFRKQLPWHPHHDYFVNVLQTDEERIMATIRGLPAQAGLPVPLESIGHSFRSYLPWLDTPDVLVVRFEDLVGAAGGGDRQAQLDAIRAVGEFIDRPLDEESLARVADQMYSTKGMTFRKGRTGDWRNHFTAEHVEAFNEEAGDVLVELGYEATMPNEDRAES